MWLLVAFLSVLCLVLAYLLNSQFDKRTKLFEEYTELKAYQKLAKEEEARHLEVQDDLRARQKALSVDSIRTALRFNGFSPEIPDTHEPGIVSFKIDGTSFRIVSNHLPLISLELGFNLEDSGEDLALLQRSAAEVTQNLFIGKAYIIGEGSAVVFSAEFIGDSYIFFRDNLKQYLNILHEAYKHFYETLDTLKKKKEEELKSVFSGNCFVQESISSHKVQS